MTTWSLTVSGLLILALTTSGADAQQSMARTCVTTAPGNIGAVTVLRQIDPKQGCPSGEQLYEWESSGFDWQDAWSASTTYELDDAVSLRGTSYLSLDDGNLNNDPEISPGEWAIGSIDTEIACDVRFSHYCEGLVDTHASHARDSIVVEILETGAPVLTGDNLSNELAP